MNNINIITNNCLGGFIYRDIFKCKYQNPFIWTLFEINDFIDFINNFEKINFNNITIDKNGIDLNNNFITVIDNKYRLKNPHIKFDKNFDKPTKSTKYPWYIYYNKPWEYIFEKYNKRLALMKGKPKFLIYEPEITEKQIEKLIDICEKHKYKCCIITNKNVIETKYINKIEFETNNLEWEKDLIPKCKKKIIEFLINEK